MIAENASSLKVMLSAVSPTFSIAFGFRNLLAICAF
jgi:hypothetical protein